MLIGTCMPGDTLATGLPSFSHVRLGTGTPEASHSSLTFSFTTAVTVPPLLEISGGTVSKKIAGFDGHNCG